MNYIKKRYFFLLLCCAVVLSLVIRTDIEQFFSLENLKMQAVKLRELSQTHYLAVLFSYFFVFITATILFIPVTIFLTILGGFLFGSWAGAFYASLAATIGGSLLFLIIRHLLADWVHEKYQHRFVRFDKEIQKHGARYLLFLQISPITPTFFINLFMGLTNISFSTYVWTTFIGMIPGSIVYAMAGHKLQAITTLEDIMPPLVFLALFLVSLIGIVPPIVRYILAVDR